MGIIEIILFGFGLSADAFAVSITEGLKLKEKNLSHGLKVALFFGGFQALMPVIGFYIGDLMVRIPALEPAVGWIAFGLLFFVSLKMLWDTFSFHKEEKSAPIASYGELLMMAVATSIDAMTVGVTFASRPEIGLPFASRDLDVIAASLIIGVITFLCSLVGVRAGRAIGSRFSQKAQIAGGIILLGLSVKMLLENLGVKLF